MLPLALLPLGLAAPSRLDQANRCSPLPARPATARIVHSGLPLGPHALPASWKGAVAQLRVGESLTVAAPVDKMEEVLRMCASLSCVHIEEYGHFQDGIGVGRALSTEGANKTSAMLTKVRAVSSSVQAINTDGPMPLNEAKKLVDSFESKIDDALRRIEMGEYGYCEETGEPIGVRRLIARPIATLSIEAQERHERMEKTHRDD